MTKDPDTYFSKGCGRCPQYDSPACKVNKWTDLLLPLREVLKNTVLVEEAKWGVPCYTYKNKNILILSAFKEYCSISFFKGALLKDPGNYLIKPTENSTADRAFRFTDLKSIEEMVPIIEDYVKEAIENEEAGLKVESKPVSDYAIAEEFQLQMDQDPALKSAFEALTPGRKKGYLLHFAQPKQSKTRVSRIEKCIPKIMDGLGLNDRF